MTCSNEKNQWLYSWREVQGSWWEGFLSGIALCAIVALWVCISMSFWIRPASPHDAPSGFTYPASCCSPDHLSRVCHQVKCNDVTPQDNGAYVWGGLTFGNGQVYDSPDGFCHACNEMSEGKPSSAYCLLLPNNNAMTGRWVTMMYDHWRKK